MIFLIIFYCTLNLEDKMKFVICFSLCVVLAAGVEIVPKTLTREIKADVLRGNNCRYISVNFCNRK